MIKDCKSILRQIKYDIKLGINRNKFKYIILVIMVVLFCYIFNIHIRLYNKIDVVGNIGYFDYIMNLFCGMPVYTNHGFADRFIMQPTWFIINVYVTFIIGGYVTYDYKKRSNMALLHTGDKFTWWISKIIWVIINVFMYYVIIFLVVGIFVMLKGQQFNCNRKICNVILGISINRINYIEIILKTMIVPIIVTSAISLGQVVIAIYTTEPISICIVISYLSMSAYYCSNYLIGNYSMACRTLGSASMINLNCKIGSLICVCIGAAFTLIGYFIFVSKDIYSKK